MGQKKTDPFDIKRRPSPIFITVFYENRHRKRSRITLLLNENAYRALRKKIGIVHCSDVWVIFDEWFWAIGALVTDDWLTLLRTYWWPEMLIDIDSSHLLMSKRSRGSMTWCWMIILFEISSQKINIQSTKDTSLLCGAIDQTRVDSSMKIIIQSSSYNIVYSRLNQHLLIH